MNVSVLVGRCLLILVLLFPSIPAESQFPPPSCSQWSCVDFETGLEYCVGCQSHCEYKLHGVYQTFGWYCSSCGYACPMGQVRAPDTDCNTSLIPVSFGDDARVPADTAPVDRNAVFFQFDLHDPVVYAQVAEAAPEIAMYLLMNDYRVSTIRTAAGERVAPAADQRMNNAHSQILPSHEYAIRAWEAFESEMFPGDFDRYLREIDTGSPALPVGAVVRLESFVLPLPAGGMEMTIRSSLTRFNVETGSREVLEVLNRATLVLREKSRTFARVDLPGGESANSGLYEIAAVEISQN